MAQPPRSHSASNARSVIPTLLLCNGRISYLQRTDADGETTVITKTNPSSLLDHAKLWSTAGELIVMPLMGKESDHIEAISALVPRIRVGVGSVNGEDAIEESMALLDSGVVRVIVNVVGSGKESVGQLPPDRVTAAIVVDDAGNVLATADGLAPLAKEAGEVVEGAVITPGMSIEEAIAAVGPLAKSILVTFAAIQGSCAGLGDDRRAVVTRISQSSTLANLAQVTIRGGIASASDIQFLDALGIESSITTALVTGKLQLGDAISAVMRSDRADGLITTAVVDECLVCLGVCYSNPESIREAVAKKQGIYWSRSRSSLWIKGETSGDVQELLRIDMDCDRDALRFVVRQQGTGFCHVARRSCFGDDSETIGALMRVLISRRETAPVGSYTRRLFDDEALLRSKLHEEADELLEATEPGDIAWETADVIYFALTACARHGVTLDEVQASLQRRTLRVRRRPGNAKPPPEPAAAQ